MDSVLAVRLKVEAIESSCCGMAGSFGYAADTYRAAGDAMASQLTLHFERPTATTPQSFTVEAGRVTNIRFLRR